MSKIDECIKTAKNLFSVLKEEAGSYEQELCQDLLKQLNNLKENLEKKDESKFMK